MRALNSISLYACVSLIYMLSSSINEVCIFNIKYVKKFTLMRLGMLSDMQHIQLYHMNTVFRFRTHNLAPHNSVKWIGLISCYEGLNQIVITCYGIVEIFGCFFYYYSYFLYHAEVQNKKYIKHSVTVYLWPTVDEKLLFILRNSQDLSGS